eukprot:TRINITY_DN12105_c0_g3_i1.p1 TRINITY_DN12105_c0_g3~~TRINITY_DN12105_c0_g3_i1.p1  ORF type:complete len:274 (-),score=60.58 TRINITY_DN12105_c0_g3_i1:172-993(-)
MQVARLDQRGLSNNNKDNNDSPEPQLSDEIGHERKASGETSSVAITTTTLGNEVDEDVADTALSECDITQVDQQIIRKRLQQVRTGVQKQKSRNRRGHNGRSDQELAKLPDKEKKRIIANRASARRSKEKKLRAVIQLEVRTAMKKKELLVKHAQLEKIKAVEQEYQYQNQMLEKSLQQLQGYQHTSSVGQFLLKMENLSAQNVSLPPRPQSPVLEAEEEERIKNQVSVKFAWDQECFKIPQVDEGDSLVQQVLEQVNQARGQTMEALEELIS